MTDECYCQFLYDSEPFSIASLPGAKETVLVAGSLSKTYAMTGWRIGFGLAPAPIVTAMTKLQSHSTSNPTSISQKAAVEALARAAGFGGRHARRVSPAARFRGPAPARHSGRDVRRAARRFLRLSERGRRAGQERHRRYPATGRAPAGGGPRGRGPGRSFRHGPTRPHLLRGIHARVWSAASTASTSSWSSTRSQPEPQSQTHAQAHPPHALPARKSVGQDSSLALVSGFRNAHRRGLVPGGPRPAAAGEADLHRRAALGAGASRRRRGRPARQDGNVAHPGSGAGRNHRPGLPSSPSPASSFGRPRARAKSSVC